MSKFYKIIDKINKLSKINDKHSPIAKFIISNHQVVSTYKIAAFASELFTSPSTISRFIQKVGFSRYSEFQYVFKYHYEEYENESKKLQQNSNQNFPDLVKNIYFDFENTLKQTTEILEAEKIEAAANEICKASEIIFLAIGSSFLAAKDFARKLIRIGLNVKISSEFSLQESYCQLSNSTSLIIAVSYSGFNQFIVKNLETAIQNQTKIITITKNITNDISNCANIALYVAADESVQRYASSLSRLGFIYLFDILFMNILENNQEKYIDNLKKCKTLF